MDRAERKRQRERQRRNEVNQGFDDLLDLLVRIDPSVRQEVERREEARRNQQQQQPEEPSDWVSSNNCKSENQLLNRVELITKAADVLRRLYEENIKRKNIVKNLHAERRSQQPAKIEGPTANNKTLSHLPPGSPPAHTIPTLLHQSSNTMLQNVAAAAATAAPPNITSRLGSTAALSLGLLPGNPISIPNTGLGSAAAAAAAAVIELQLKQQQLFMKETHTAVSTQQRQQVVLAQNMAREMESANPNPVSMRRMEEENPLSALGSQNDQETDENDGENQWQQTKRRRTDGDGDQSCAGM